MLFIGFNPFEVDAFLYFRCEKNGGGGREWRKVALADTDTLAGGNETGKSFSISSAVSFILFWKVETARKLQEPFFRLIFFKRGQFVCLTLFEGRTNERKTSPKLILVAQASPPSIEPGD